MEINLEKFRQQFDQMADVLISVDEPIRLTFLLAFVTTCITNIVEGDPEMLKWVVKEWSSHILGASKIIKESTNNEE